VSDALARLGAEYDVEVGADATMFTLTTLARFGERGARLLSQMLTSPSLRTNDFARVRQLRLDRLKQLKDLPPAVAERAFLRLLYPAHPYGHLAIGTEESLRSVSLDDVVSFHRATFVPHRATLVVAGALSHAELLRLADDAFAGWTGGTFARLTGRARASADAGSAHLAIVPREGAAQSELRIGHLSARRDTPDYAPLLVMNAILGGQFVSRINMKLREEKAFTYGARTGSIGDAAWDRSSFRRACIRRQRQRPLPIRLAEISGLRGSRPATAQEMSLAQASLTRGYPRNFETTQQVARSVAQLALFDLPDTYFEQFVPKVNAVTADEVTRVAHTLPRSVTRHRARGRRRLATEQSLAALGLGELHVLPPA
jgi:predicted Zn-dependent peptidase